ncbi:hypothetical protein [Eisenbergiella tayi]|uniref:hypothetical protein n=1 Tax=Eisenbergiella tayi TaxID=1432052 RepID=UPI00307C3AD4
MMKIQLFNGYFIEPDLLNLALKQSYTGKDKNGNERESEKIIGYWGRENLSGLIKRFYSLIEAPEDDNRIISMQEYVDRVEQSHQRLEDWLKENYARVQSDIKRDSSRAE